MLRMHVFDANVLDEIGPSHGFAPRCPKPGFHQVRRHELRELLDHWKKTSQEAMCAFNVQRCVLHCFAEWMAKRKRLLFFAVCDYVLQPFRITFDVFQLAGSDKFSAHRFISLWRGSHFSTTPPGDVGYPGG